MSIWHHTPGLEQVNRRHDNTVVSQLGIEFTEAGEDSLGARIFVVALGRTARRATSRLSAY